MIIKRVTIDDAQELLDIYSYYVEQTAVSFEYETPSLEEFKERIVNISSKYPYIKAEDNGKIVGYAYATTFKARKAYDWSVETTIYIDKNQRNKGIGRELYETLEKSLKNMGILNLNACIASPKEEDLRLSNDSEKFHEKLGFK
ncbi:MAG: N-acetyltransferase family protein, partial [Bacilli bacterium]|nr:N-acetyltransferase family protein [Bacilli bacterium]